MTATSQATDWFNGDQYHPALPGYYQVRTCYKHHPRSQWRLVGADMRYWDGVRWLTWEGGHESTFGQHVSHQWRGRRQWVLSVPSLPVEGGGRAYVISASTNGTRSTVVEIYNEHWKVGAKPFETRAEAEAYARGYPQALADWKAVLA